MVTISINHLANCTAKCLQIPALSDLSVWKKKEYKSTRKKKKKRNNVRKKSYKNGKREKNW